MEYEITYEQSPELIKRLLRQFIITYIGWSKIIIIGICGIFSVAISLFGDFPWIGGFGIASVLFYFGQLIRVYTQGVKKVNELKDRSITVKFTNDNVIFQYIDYTCISNWSRFSELWVLRDLWVLFTSFDTPYTMVPSTFISKEIDEFIMSKFSERKAKVYRQV